MISEDSSQDNGFTESPKTAPLPADSDEVSLCKGCGAMKHTNADGYCGRCVAADSDGLEAIMRPLLYHVGGHEEMREYEHAKAALQQLIVKARFTGATNELAKIGDEFGLTLDQDFIDASDLAKAVQAIIAEKERGAIQQATQPYSYNMPMKSMRTRNTAFKLYAVKFFNTKIKERRERMLQQLKDAADGRGDTK